MEAAGAIPVGVVISLDRQELTGRPEDGGKQMSAIQSVEAQFGIPVVSIVKLSNVITYLAGAGQTETLKAVKAYRDQYGVEY